MHTHEVCVATITRARDLDEEGLIGRTLRALTAQGFPTVAADGGSRPDFVRELSGIPNLTVIAAAQPGLIGQIKASVRLAQARGTRHILYVEADKDRFVSGPMKGFLAAVPADDDAAIVLASRTAASFATFPPFQRRTESAFNAVAASIFGVDADFLYGPFVMNGTVAALVETVAPDLGWGWRPFVFAVAHRLGHRIRIIEGDYACPPEQVEEHDADRLHRLRQLGENIKGLVEAAK